MDASTLPNPLHRFEDFLRDLSKLSNAQLRTLADTANQLIRQREPKRDRVEELMERIKTGGPDKAFWEQYEVYYHKSEAETLSESEAKIYEEMFAVTRKWDLERLQMVIELARLWKTHPKEVMARLNIRSRRFSHA